MPSIMPIAAPPPNPLSKIKAAAAVAAARSAQPRRRRPQPKDYMDLKPRLPGLNGPPDQSPLPNPAASAPAANPAPPPPDLSKMAFRLRLHFPAPRCEDPAKMLTQPPRWEPHPHGRPPTRRSLRTQDGFNLSATLLLSLHEERRLLAKKGTRAAAQISSVMLTAALTLTDLQRQAYTIINELTVPGLRPGGPPPEERLLPLANYPEFRRRLDPLLEEHRQCRDTWLRELLPRRRRQAQAQGQPEPTEQALLQQWQANLELNPAPTLAEYIGKEKEPELRQLRRTLYEQAWQRCRRHKPFILLERDDHSGPGSPRRPKRRP